MKIELLQLNRLELDVIQSIEVLSVIFASSFQPQDFILCIRFGHFEWSLSLLWPMTFSLCGIEQPNRIHFDLSDNIEYLISNIYFDFSKIIEGIVNGSFFIFLQYSKWCLYYCFEYIHLDLGLTGNLLIVIIFLYGFPVHNRYFILNSVSMVKALVKVFLDV